MATFTYNALDRQGRAVSGTTAADSRGGAIAALAEEGIFVTDVSDGVQPAQKAHGEPASRPGRHRRVPPRVKASMLRQLATALQAGLPMLPALRVVHEQAESEALAELAADLAQRVQGGESLSGALEAHPRQFNRLEVSMARVGETAGLLEQVMGHLADFAERDLEVRERIRSAATYPAFVLVLAAIAVVIVVTVIVPRVMAALADNVTVLPAPTRALLALSEFLQSYGLLLLAALGLGIWAFRRWLSKPAGRLAFDAFKLRIPVLGTALRRVAVARFARTLGTLSRSGIQILEAFRVLRDTLGNEALARKLDEVAAGITQGQSIAEPLRRTGQFPPLLIQVIAMGEKTGRLDDLLLQTASAYEKETDAAIHRVMTVLPAVFIVLMALVVAFVLAAVLLPIVQMETSVPGM
jgi:type II secretory pathway component PulF